MGQCLDRRKGFNNFDDGKENMKFDYGKGTKKCVRKITKVFSNNKSKFDSTVDGFYASGG